MNYLAHAFLSGTNNELLVGNFIADSVRGSQLQHFPSWVAQGIVLHRQIDAFTDSHPVVQKSKERLRPKYRKYAGVITDIYYDHFLAANFNTFSPIKLPQYAQHVYDVVNRYEAILPERVNYFLPYMVKQNWLLSYAEITGIRKSLTGLSRRTTFISDMETAADELEENYSMYATEFFLFFPDLQAYVRDCLQALRND